MNLTAKLGMLRGYGAVSDAPDYTRNSGCGGVCGRPAAMGSAGAPPLCVPTLRFQL